MDRVYESMIIVKSELADEEREDVFEQIAKYVTDSGGKVQESKIWAKERNFYFPIRSRGAEKKRHNKGLYWLFRFSFDTQKLGGLKEAIRLEERILRSITFNRSN